MSATDNVKPDYDHLIQTIVDYVLDYEVTSNEAYKTAKYCLLDSLGCALLALNYPECTKLLGPLVPGLTIKKGARVPGTAFELDPVQAAFNIGTMVRWLDFNDTWLAAEWGHPSDNLGAILAVADYVNRQGTGQLTMQDVLTAMIKAHEIQGVIALNNSFNRVGLDHVILVKIASCVISLSLMGAGRDAMLRALSNVFVDGQSLRTYRHAPNAGSRKSWAAGDATARAVRLALIAQTGEMGYPSALTAPNWGFEDVLFNGKKLEISQPFGSYVMENILFKLSYPAEFHAQTAVECAVNLHKHVHTRLDAIQKIELFTHESAIRIISKNGPLHNPADRDHCLQYMVAMGLIHGDLTAKHYEEEYARDPRVDRLREKMSVKENLQYTRDYLNPNKRSIANQVRVFLQGEDEPLSIAVEYPIGHQRRRDEGMPVLIEKFKINAKTCFSEAKVEQLFAEFENLGFEHCRVDDFMQQWMCEAN